MGGWVWVRSDDIRLPQTVQRDQRIGGVLRAVPVLYWNPLAAKTAFDLYLQMVGQQDQLPRSICCETRQSDGDRRMMMSTVFLEQDEAGVWQYVLAQAGLGFDGLQRFLPRECPETIHIVRSGGWRNIALLIDLSWNADRIEVTPIRGVYDGWRHIRLGEYFRALR